MSCQVPVSRTRNRLPEFESLLDQFFGPATLKPLAAVSTAWRTPITVWEAGDKLHVELDVPGAKQEDVELTFDKGQLSISVERKGDATQEEGRKVWHNERVYGRVTRTVSLPETVDPDTIEAELNAGVLHVAVTKRPEAQPKRIEVRTV